MRLAKIHAGGARRLAMEAQESGRRTSKAVLSLALLFALAVLVGRLAVNGGWSWAVLVLLFPLSVVVLAASVGPRGGVLLAFLILGVALAARFVLRNLPGAWITLALILVVAATVAIVGRVVAVMLADRRARLRGGAGDEGPEKAG
jgi:K+-sensing histidine kinase KdpD